MLIFEDKDENCGNCPIWSVSIGSADGQCVSLDKANKGMKRSYKIVKVGLDSAKAVQGNSTSLHTV